MHDTSSSTLRRSRPAALLLAAAAGVAAVLLTGGGSPGSSGAADAAAVEPAAFDASQLTYQIVTRSGATEAACRAATPRVTNAVVEVPQLVRMGNVLVPDTNVLLTVLPTSGDSLVVDLVVARIVSSPIRAQLEVVVKPESGGSPERVAFGYDGCEAGAPSIYKETVQLTSKRLSLSTRDVPSMPALTMTGSQFELAPDGTRDHSRIVTARMAPMPLSTQTAVVTEGPDSYHATMRARPGTNVQLHHALFEDDGGTSTVDAEIGRFPGRLDIDLSPTLIDYVAAEPYGEPLSKPIDFVDIATSTITPGEGEERLRALLEQVPARGVLERTSDTRVEVTAPVGPIGAATVSYASIPEGTTTLPPLVPEGSQYLVARKIHDLLLAEVRVEGLSHAVVDAGDPKAGPDPATDNQTDKIPTVVEATHKAGPFVIDAAVTTRPENSPVDVTRSALARVLDLPATARVEFGAATQSFDYEGSSDIALLTADVTSTEPFVDDANAAHLRITDFPTGLEGRFDEKGKAFNARVPNGAIGRIELQATSGPDLTLPDGVDGLLLEDHDGAYTAFARLSGLERISMNWGRTLRADVEHAPGPFDVLVDIDDPDTADPANNVPATDLDLGIAVRNLPGAALLEYTAAGEGVCDIAPCPKVPSTLKFTGDGAVNSIDLDVVSSQKLIQGGEGNKGATELHGLIRNIPAGSIDVVVDGENKNMTAKLSAPAPDFVVEVEACSTGECGTPIETLKLPADNPDTVDGLWLEDLEDSYHLFGRITGLTDLTLSWSDNVVVKAQKKAGPFDIVVKETKLLDFFGFDISYGSRTSVGIRDLPSSIDLSFAKGAKSLTYQGSAPISLIEAWLSVDRIAANLPEGPKVLTAIAGRATEAYVRITDLPTTITLTTEFAEEGDESELLSATLNASPNTIGSVYIELSSDESLLEAQAVKDIPVLDPAFQDDGLVFWDLDDGDASTLEPVDDPYIIVARVTQLRSIHFEQYKLGEEFRDKVLAAEMDRATHRNIWIDVRKPSDEKMLRPIAGFTPEYRYEYTRMGMDVPPEKLKFEALITKKDNDDFRTLRVETHADADATSMTVETDAGSESLTAYLQPVPAGATYADPGAVACVSPGSMDCQPDHRVGHAGSEPVSVALDVAKPVHIDVVRVERKAFQGGFFFPEFHVHMDIEKYLQASKEADFDNCNEYFVYVDTQGFGVQGDIIDYSTGGSGGTDLDVHLPPGTEAQERWVKIEGPPCKGSITGTPIGDPPSFQMSCPSGMDVIFDAFNDIDVHLEDELCPEPRIFNVEDGATGQPVVVSRGSNGGQPVPLTMHLYGRGFAPVTCSDDFSGWPPCTGSTVLIGKFVNGFFQASDNFTIVSRTWHWTDHVEVVVEVDPDTPVGNWTVFIDNPETGTDTCTTQEVGGEDVPCFSVVE